MMGNREGRTGRAHLLFLLVVLLGVLVAGCLGKTPPVQYYILSAPAEALTVESDRHRGAVGSVGIGPVEIPDLLDRPHIVTRTGQNRVHIDEFHRWGGELKNVMVAVLARSLAFHLGTHRVYPMPRRTLPKPDYQVLVTVHRFDGSLGATVSLDTTWTVLSTATGKPLADGQRLVQERVSGGGYEALAAAQSRCLFVLSREIAGALADLGKK